MLKQYTLSWQFIGLLILACIVLSGCASQSPAETATPTLSSITLMMNPNIEDVLAGQTIAFSVDASGQNLRFKWSAARGSLSANDTPAVIYTAPETAGVDTVTVEVSSASGALTRSKSIKVVLPPTPVPTQTSTTAPSQTPTATSVVPTATLTPPPLELCDGSTSAELIANAWGAEDEPEKRIACTQLIIDRWTDQANNQQATRVNSFICQDTPAGNNTAAVNDFHASFWAVNDVATAWLLRGYALDELGRTEEAQAAYQTVVSKYFCGHAWDPKQKIFWNVADTAKDRLP